MSLNEFSIEQLQAEVDRRRLSLITPAEIEAFFQCIVTARPYSKDSVFNAPITDSIKKLAMIGWHTLQPKPEHQQD